MNLYGPKQLVESARTVRKNTIQIAEDIPEADYNYRPTPDSRSVQETLVHIASVSRLDRIIHEEQRLFSLEGFDFGAALKKGEAEEHRVRTKSDVIALLRTRGDEWCQWVERVPESFLSEQVRQPGGALRTRLEMLVGSKEHEMHHRGQLMLMERLLGIVPHLTRNRHVRQDAVAGA